MTVLDFAPSATRGGVASVRVHNDLWRITRRDGEVLGYIERSDTAAGARYLAKRMRQRRFFPVGEFWDFGTAVDCFRF